MTSCSSASCRGVTLLNLGAKALGSASLRLVACREITWLNGGNNRGAWETLR